MRIVAIISCVVLIVGSTLITAPVLMVIGFFTLLRTIYQLVRGNKGYTGILIAGLVCLLLMSISAFLDYTNYRSTVPEFGTFNNWFTNYVNPGLYFAFFGSLGLFVSGWILGNVSQNLKEFISEAYASRHQGKAALFVADRIAFNQQKSFSRFIIRLSIVATTISVAVMIMTLALVNGFQDAVGQKVFSFWGHVRIQEKQPEKSVLTEEIPIVRNDSLVTLIKQNPEIKTIHPFATKYAILKTKDEMEGVMVKGFDSTYDFNYFKPFLKQGRPVQFNDSTYSREIMISANTANELEMKLNDRVLIYFIRPDGSFRPDRLTIVGIYKTGIEEYDKTFAIGDIKLIQRLNEWSGDEIGGYEVFLKDYNNIDRTVQELYALDQFPQDWDTKSVREISPNIFDWLNMQDVSRNVLIGIMVFVAVMNLITCLLILVLERVQMIGVLKSLGASSWTIQRIFLRHSLIITLTGIILGAILAIGLLYLQKETGFIQLKEEAYYLSEAAVKIVWWQVAFICIATLVVCFLVLMIPSVLARKIPPVKAIHFR